MHRLSTLSLLALALLAAGCDDGLLPVEPDPPALSLTTPPSRGLVSAGIQCTVDLSAGSTGCAPAREKDPRGVGGINRLLVLKQCQKVCVVSGEPTFNPTTRVYSFPVCVRNVMLRSRIGTADGVNLRHGTALVLVEPPHAVEGTGTIGIVDPKHRVWAHTSLPKNTLYSLFQEVTPPGGTTSCRPWIFVVPPTVTRFAFRMAVVTDVEPHVCVSEVLLGAKNPAGAVTAGMMVELQNCGEAPITNVSLSVQDSVHTPRGALGYATMAVADEWPVGQRRLAASLDLYNVLPVAVGGGYGAYYTPAAGFAHTIRVTTGGYGKVMSRVHVPASALVYDGHSRERTSDLAAPSSDLTGPQWVRSTTPIATRCAGSPTCPALFGTPRQ